MTDMASAHTDSLLVSMDGDGIIITFESPRLLEEGVRVEVCPGRVRVVDDVGILVDASGVDDDVTTALKLAGSASLVGIAAGEDGDVFDVRDNSPIGEFESDED